MSATGAAVKITICPMRGEDLDAVIALQSKCFPPPFDPDLHWQRHHLLAHLEKFPEGQFVGCVNGRIVASASNALIADSHWDRHVNWNRTVGGPTLELFDPNGGTLFGLDICVDPDFRGRGVARELYRARFGLVRALGLTRFGTGCRIPDFLAWSRANPGRNQADYCNDVLSGREQDRTLTPLLKLGVSFVRVVNDYMDDAESGNAAAILEWRR